MRSHVAKRLNFRLSKIFKLGSPDDLKSIKAFLVPRTASKLHGITLSQKWSSRKNGRKRFEAVWEARVIFTVVLISESTKPRL